MKIFRFVVTTIFLAALIVNGADCSAAEKTSKSVKKVGVLIIGGDEFKKEKFFTATKDIAPKDKSYLVKVGDEIQTLWYDYCKEKNISPEKPPKTDEVIEFVAQNNFHRVLALVIQDAKEGKYDKVDLFGHPTGAWGSRVLLRVSGYLFGNSELIKTQTAVNKRDSDWNLLSREPELRARLGAFRLCANDIGKNLRDAW